MKAKRELPSATSDAAESAHGAAPAVARQSMEADACVVGGEISFELRGSALVLRDAGRGETLFSMPEAKFCLPNFASGARLVSRECGDGAPMRLAYSGGTLARGEVTVTPHGRGFLVRGEFTPREDVTVNRLDILPPGTTTLFYEANNYRNFHATDQVFERVVLGAGEFACDTYSRDWQFAPHPTAMLFTRNNAHLLVGATEPPVGGYGLYASGGNWRFDRFYLHYGDGEWGWKIGAGETWRTPEFYFAFDRGGDVHGAWRLFAEDLVRDGRIADPARRRVVP